MAWFCFLYYFINGVYYDYDTCTMSLLILFKLPKGLIQPFSSKACFHHALRRKTTSGGAPIESDKFKLKELKASHLLYIKELYKDREAPVVPFDCNLILGTCSQCLDLKVKTKFLKEWGYKGCIYIIGYKYDPLIYYIGITNLFKRRFNNHLKAESSNKLHVFLNLVGWEHFNISIIEVCSHEKQGARENYYLHKYLPLLNTTFSSSFSYSAIYKSLNSKLAILSNTSDKVTGQPLPTFVYEINSKGIKKTFLKYNSITEASFNEKRARGTLGIYIDTNVPFRNKLYYSKPIKDFESTFHLVKTVSKDLKLDSNIAKELWVYDA